MSTNAERTSAITDTYFSGPQSAALGASGNGADCALCHSTDGSLEGRAGESMKDIAYLSGYKGQSGLPLLDAVNACVTGWMGGPALTAEDPAWQALQAYLESISTEERTSPNDLTPEVLESLDAYEQLYADGNAEAGASAYQDYCAVCHDTGLALGGIPAPAASTLGQRSAGRIAQKVRTSGPPPADTSGEADTTGGPMPFFEPEELPAATLRNIIAYLQTPN